MVAIESDSRQTCQELAERFSVSDEIGRLHLRPLHLLQKAVCLC
jgi:hypothetical protein